MDHEDHMVMVCNFCVGDKGNDAPVFFVSFVKKRESIMCTYILVEIKLETVFGEFFLL